MSSKIIPFPASGSPRPPSFEERQEELRETRAALVRTVRSCAADPTARPLHPYDAILPAQIVDGLIKDAKAQKITQDVLKSAMSDRGLPVRIERMRVKKGLGFAEAKSSRPKDLVRKVRPYVALIELLAKLLHRSADDLIYEAFRHTQLGMGALRSFDEPVGELSGLVHEMFAAVVASAGVRDYFDKARRTSCMRDPVTGRLLRSLGSSFGEGGWEGYCDICIASNPPFPAVSLFRVRAGEFKGPLQVERKPIAAFDAPIEGVAADVWEGGNERPLGAMEVVQATITLYTDVRLVIAPVSRSEDLGPLFETRSYVELKTNGRNRPLTFPYALFPICAVPTCSYEGEEYESDLKGYIGTVAAQFEDGWRRISGFGQGGWTGTKEISPEIGARIEAGICADAIVNSDDRYPYRGEWAVYYEPVTPATVGKLEKLSGYYTPLFNQVGDRPQPKELICAGACRSLETALMTGALESALADDCRRLRAQLDALAQGAREVRAQEVAAVRAAWRKMAAAATDHSA